MELEKYQALEKFKKIFKNIYVYIIILLVAVVNLECI